MISNADDILADVYGLFFYLQNPQEFSMLIASPAMTYPIILYLL